MFNRIILLISLIFLAAFSQVKIIYTANLDRALTGCGCPLSPYSGLDRVAGFIKEERRKADNIIAVDTGDLFGTYPGKLLDISAWRGMEISGYDLFLPGDQDFMYGHAFLDSLTKGSSVSLLKGCLSDYYFVPDKLIKKKGITFGFLGYHGDESRADFPDEVKKMWLNPDIGEEIEKIAGKCDRVIILSHAGVDENIRLAKSITGVDVIIGGHTQEVVDTLVNGIRIVQPGADAERVGVLVFGDKGTNPVRIANKMIIMDDKIPRDTLIYNMVSDKKVRKE